VENVALINHVFFYVSSQKYAIGVLMCVLVYLISEEIISGQKISLEMRASTLNTILKADDPRKLSYRNHK
jgi:hypothetical protein